MAPSDSSFPTAAPPGSSPEIPRLHALDAVRGFALLAGVALHAAMSFMPGLGLAGWPIIDRSPSVALAIVVYVVHIFRMATFFVLAGFFGRLLRERLGTRAFVRNRSRRILIPFVVAWPAVLPLIVATLVWGSLKSGITVPQQPIGATRGGIPLTHLWFLYLLLLLYPAALCLRWAFERSVRDAAATRVRIDAWIRRLTERPWGVVALAAPLAVALYFTPEWRPWWGIPTPDHSFIPNRAAFTGYGTAFVFGWLLHRQPELIRVWERRWPVHLAVAGVLTLVCLMLVDRSVIAPPAAPGWRTALYATLYALALWNWIFAVIGVAVRFLSTASAVRRYVADASYWIYIAHLPVVFGLQAAVMDWDWHWTIKFPLILSASLVVLFVSYEYLVRPTIIGEVLNGRRYSRAPRRVRESSDTTLVPS